ncbi:hypothetical protein FVEN_g12408 [Fusarium venenatum]|uniref:Uncharacterized protein n=1 Tax=Fusarium venenatum TaxID=56646 RepID=A0A2L2T4D2_9HYPO|nr:uncharacterized protein FVRRES_12830 [Fusarium venenatum]KAG8349366.1 hypothetical protein FVEN_g12408 [Fusarium venenatum]KAH6979410.1 hypothetical protein EDB82DRAFT_253527 [Fusarium venenatum]CEI40139.1 unnamed protein product [Fusarium venenatum]
MGDRPAIYVHLEMGLTLPKIMSKDRHITYVSKSMRDRANQFPRQLPPANTNYLNSSSQYQAGHQQMLTQTQPTQYQLQHQFAYHANNLPPNTYSRDPVSTSVAQGQSYQPYRPQQVQHDIREYYAPNSTAPPPPQRDSLQPDEVLRSSRSTRRGSHERGKSAPPPLNSSPWDISPPHASGNEPHLWKALPATPNQFRLGEGDMPWDLWTFPVGLDDNNEEDDHGERGDGRKRSREASLRATWGPEFPSEYSRPTQPVQVDDRARGKANDIQSLASALMTVDNGFEDQWWYQGPRLVNIHGNVMVPTAVPKSSFHPDHQQSSVGWAVSHEEAQRLKNQNDQHQLQQKPQEQQRRRQRHLSLQEQQLESFVPSNASFQPVSPYSGTNTADIVSPLSDYPSPLSSYGGLRRSLTTRSDELHL